MVHQKLQLFELFFVTAIFLEFPKDKFVEPRSLEVSTVENDNSTIAPLTTTAQHKDVIVQQLISASPTVPTVPVSVTDNSSSVESSIEAQDFREKYSYSSGPKRNQSLYDELKSTSPLDQTSSPFETSLEFIKFENLAIGSNSEDTTSEESIESKFREDEKGFRNNASTEVRHVVDEGIFDGVAVKYSSMIIKTTEKPDPVIHEKENLNATKIPFIEMITTKKAKSIEINPQTDGNINTSIPITSEVWALAGMRNNEQGKDKNRNSSAVISNPNHNSTAKNLLDWSEITKMTAMKPENEDENASISKTTLVDYVGGIEDLSKSENKEDLLVSPSFARMASTHKPLVKDVRIELDNTHTEFAGTNKSFSPNSRLDVDEFSKTLDESEDSAIDLVDSLNKFQSKNKEENIQEEETNEMLPTTTSNENLSTDNTYIETSSMIDSEATTSSVDSFTEMAETGREDESDSALKMTTTENSIHTIEPFTERVVTTQYPETTTFVEITELETTRDIQTSPTKSISTRLASKTEFPKTYTNPFVDNESFSSTLIPRFITTKTTSTTEKEKPRYTEMMATVETTYADDKFKYGTLLPLATSADTIETVVEMQKTTIKTSTLSSESFNKESLDGEQSNDSRGHLGLISASISVVAIVIIAGIIYFIMKQRNKQKFSQRCRPVGLDAYSLDNVSVYNSVRRKANALRLSKRSYGNSAFEDPSLQSNVLDYQSLQNFIKNKITIHNEFKEIPQITVRIDEVPENCEDKNRYANIIPLPETRVILKRLGDDEKSEYINANYVKGPKDNNNYYIATQAPIENTVTDFWRMIWEQNSKVIIMATDLSENGVERCAEYIPASVVLDNSLTFGDFIVTLKSREVKEKYAISQLHLKNMESNTWREIIHLWYSWPESGCPTEPTSIINLLIDARNFLRTTLPEHLDENSNSDEKTSSGRENLSTLDKTKSLQRTQGPLTVHCSPGTGRTGTIIACDIILRMLDTPPKQIDIPQIVYSIRRGRANAVRTKDQYEFLYEIANVPLTVHCSPGTGRTGTIIACDIILRMLDTPPKQIDIPQIVYSIRRGRANAVRTKDQYEFLYEIANVYATKYISVTAET
ncbi:CLUMA_CG020874, isoform A [Clunio marinus]|uniref:CLUMA_CG020874, isoform A n=1 Tax=Clunio marinus TaxID=568069 RepID=A0A1J1J7W7_9DIPT|nr:CLUMA_CG020874, isoform A [Clunio marinus]